VKDDEYLSFELNELCGEREGNIRREVEDVVKRVEGIPKDRVDRFVEVILGLLRYVCHRYYLTRHVDVQDFLVGVDVVCKFNDVVKTLIEHILRSREPEIDVVLPEGNVIIHVLEPNIVLFVEAGRQDLGVDTTLIIVK